MAKSVGEKTAWWDASRHCLLELLGFVVVVGCCFFFALLVLPLFFSCHFFLFSIVVLCSSCSCLADIGRCPFLLHFEKVCFCFQG